VQNDQVLDVYRTTLLLSGSLQKHTSATTIYTTSLENPYSERYTALLLAMIDTVRDVCRSRVFQEFFLGTTHQTVSNTNVYTWLHCEKVYKRITSLFMFLKPVKDSVHTHNACLLYHNLLNQLYSAVYRNHHIHLSRQQYIYQQSDMASISQQPVHTVN